MFYPKLSKHCNMYANYNNNADALDFIFRIQNLHILTPILK